MTQTFDPNRHIPVTADVPEEPVGDLEDRPDIPVPSAYARGAVVRHRIEGTKAVIHRVDHITRQLRLYYPDRPEGKRYEPRTTWHSFESWEPEITLSPEEVERQNALKLFEEELTDFDAAGLELVKVFCDDPDPIKALAKVRALKKSGMVRTAAEAKKVGPK